MQAPVTHESVWVQALLSLHPVPFALAEDEHRPVAGSQTPASRQAASPAQTTVRQRSLSIEVSRHRQPTAMRQTQTKSVTLKAE